MSLHWQIVHVIWVFELIISIVILVPSSPLSLKKQVIALGNNETVAKGLKIYFAVVAVLLAETIFEVLTSKPPSSSQPGAEVHEEYHHFESELLTNKLNAVVSGTSLLLLFVIRDLCDLSAQNSRLQTDSSVLKKQAQNASEQYIKLLDKDKTEESSEDKQRDTAKKLRNENESLKTQVEKLKTEISAVKSQAENQQQSFLKLVDENKSLKNKLEDFNLIMGDAVKKKI